jgi:omega-hydroxy-beta-dihydromenaquinone-9 sulfotransferase
MDLTDIQEDPLLVTKATIAGYTLPNFLSLLAQNKFHISPQYIPRFLYCITLSSVMAPFALKERILSDKQIRHTAITKPPVFIIGNWRSGTTYLHNVLSQDPSLGYFSTFQAYLPALFLTNEKLFKPIVVSSIPKKRPMDDVAMDADFPQEDQYAVGAFSQYSYYHGWAFPKNMEFYNNYICMENASEKTIEDWKKIYHYILQKITLYHKGKQLVLKNQDNTGKIKLLLEMYPDAKFIFIYRNPYHLYYSMIKFMKVIIPLYCLQTPPPMKIIEESMMDLYVRMTKKYLAERSAIPPGNLIELRYEDFVREPLRHMQSIYDTLHIPGYSQAEPCFKTYLDTQQNLQIDEYPITEDVRKRVEQKWGFALKEFKYSL